MLSSIHPLGERARSNRWVVTVGAFTIFATAAGAGTGAVAGALGSLVVGGWTETARLAATAAAAGAAGALDLLSAPPGPRRQVNENWIGALRGWVYGGAFGAQLGAGLATYVVTWGVYATLAAEVLSASVVGGASIGAVFGLGRSLAPIAAAWVDRPSRLTAFHRSMAAAGPLARRGAGYAALIVGALGLAGVMG